MCARSGAYRPVRADLEFGAPSSPISHVWPMPLSPLACLPVTAPSFASSASTLCEGLQSPPEVAQSLFSNHPGPEAYRPIDSLPPTPSGPCQSQSGPDSDRVSISGGMYCYRRYVCWWLYRELVAPLPGELSQSRMYLLPFEDPHSRGMHLTPETPTYSMRGCGGLPADAGGV